VAAALSLRTLPHTRPSGHRFDPLAALLCCGFFALLILALGQEAHGAAPLVVVSELAGAVICFGLLWLRQAHHPAPMLAVDLFRAPVFALSAATAVCSFAAQGLTFVSLPFLLQKVLGHSEVETGFLITPWPAVVAILAPIAGRLSDRYPPAILGGIGLAVLSLGLCSLGLLPDRPTTFDLAWRMMLCGAGFGLFQSPNLRALMTSAPPGRSGGASGIVATARLLGQTSGAALVAFCFHLWGAHGPWLALWLGCAFSAAGSLASFLRLLPRRVR
jgi:DHA2 family multidrug resistance protein-like MFS transporter